MEQIKKCAIKRTVWSIIKTIVYIITIIIAISLFCLGFLWAISSVENTKIAIVVLVITLLSVCGYIITKKLYSSINSLYLQHLKDCEDERIYKTAINKRN